jgi:hypothetical protein
MAAVCRHRINGVSVGIFYRAGSVARGLRRLRLRRISRTRSGGLSNVGVIGARSGLRRCGMGVVVDTEIIRGEVGGDAAKLGSRQDNRAGEHGSGRQDQEIVARLMFLRLVALHQGRRRWRWQRLEQVGVLDQGWRRPITRDDHVIADAGDVVQLGRKRVGEPDAAMRGGITRDDTGM